MELTVDVVICSVEDEGNPVNSVVSVASEKSVDDDDEGLVVKEVEVKTSDVVLAEELCVGVAVVTSVDDDEGDVNDVVSTVEKSLAEVSSSVLEDSGEVDVKTEVELIEELSVEISVVASWEEDEERSVIVVSVVPSEEIVDVESELNDDEGSPDEVTDELISVVELKEELPVVISVEELKGEVVVSVFASVDD